MGIAESKMREIVREATIQEDAAVKVKVNLNVWLELN